MNLIKTATVVLLVGAATVGGALFSYSSFTMRGLRSLPPGQAVAAMQAVNLAAPRGGFVVVLMGTAAGSLALGVQAAIRHDQPGWGWRLGGSALYLATIAITAGFNIPRNDVLAAVDPNGPAASTAWSEFVGSWITGNTVRTITCLGAVAAWAVSLAVQDAGQ